jgi:dTDP-glucose 4,6-dehydratase
MVKKSLMVTGGAGFIGANFVHYMAQRYPEIPLIVLDKLTYAGNIANLTALIQAEKIQFIHGDIGDRALVENVLDAHAVTTLVHFAAESHVDRSILGPEAFIHTNVVGTFSLLEAFRQYWLDRNSPADFRFLHISTDEVFGSLKHTDAAFTETTPYAPNSPYSASKAGSDHLVRAYFHTYGMPTLITNCSNNYGPYQFPEKLIPLMCVNILLGQPLPIYGDGQNIRDWLFVEDHCRALDVVLDRGIPGETYNIGGEAEINNLDLVHLLCELMDDLAADLPVSPCHELITFVTDRPGHDRRYAMNIKKIQQQLGWSPAVTLEAGLRQTVQWYLSHRDWWMPLLSQNYQTFYNTLYGARLG